MTAASTIELPTVDLGQWIEGGDDRRRFAADVVAICHEVGFFNLVGHQIDQGFLDLHAAYRARFFDLSDEVKASIDKCRSPRFRGWERIGAEHTGGRPDWREQLDLATENPAVDGRAGPEFSRLEGPNQWPDEALLPGFRAHMTEFFETMSRVSDVLLDVLSVGLGLDELHLRRLFGDRRFSLVKLIRYPPTPAGEAGVNAHHDAGFLTLLLQHDVSGLQVEAEDGSWIDVPPRPGAFVVNLGEMFQEMTGNYVVATTHRVVTDRRREASGWFHGPDLATPLDRLPLAPEFAAAVGASRRHSTAGFMSTRRGIEHGEGSIGAETGTGVYGRQLWNYYSRSYADHVARHHPDTIDHPQARSVQWR